MALYKMILFLSFSYSKYMSPSYIVSKTLREIGRKSPVLTRPPVFGVRPVGADSVGISPRSLTLEIRVRALSYSVVCGMIR